MRLMPLTQPERDNFLMRRYFQEIGLPGKQLAKRCGVSHSQIYMARTRNVGADNAEKISRGVASILGLSEVERLELKAEIMGYPEERVRAYFGDPKKAARLLDVPWRVAEEIMNEEKSITHKTGMRALEKLREIDAPEFVIESVERRLMPPPEPRRGLISHNLHGPEMAEQWKRTKEGLRYGKPRVYEALQRSGLMVKEVAEKAGVARETMRRALYGENVRPQNARAIAGVLGEGLTEDEVEALEEELMKAPKNFS
jgi:transcriptional regulator with XRE-family HTH domain